ncbi:MAG: hypothetical protein AB8G11_12660 [Saprospiraceae bacterium]
MKKTSTLIIILIILVACEKDDLDRKNFFIEVQTDEVTTSGGNITAGGTIIALGKGVQDHGHVWAETTMPTVTDNKTTLGAITTEKSYSSDITNLSPNTRYYIRAYATDGTDVFYGAEKNIKTGDIQMAMDSVTILNATTAKAYATINSLGTRPITQHGFCWALTNNEPTTNDFTTTLGNLSTQGTFNNTIDNLIADSTYFIRAYITNDQTTIYSNTLTFTIGNANVATGNIQINSASEATAIGTVTGLGVESIIQHGHCWSVANPNPSISDSKTELGGTNAAGNYNSTLPNLSTNTTYYYRAYVTTTNTVVYGEVQNFSITEHQVTTNPPSITSISTADISGTLTIGDYGITEHGHCWSSTNTTPTISNTKTTLGTKNQSGNFNSNLTNLALNTTYYIRAYAQNGNLIKYGNVETLQILPPAISTDSIPNNGTINFRAYANIISNYPVSLSQHGFCYSATNTTPTINNDFVNIGSFNGVDTFGIVLPNLIEDTDYYARAYVIQNGNVIYGNVISFQTRDIWVRKADFVNSSNPVSFSLNGKGYMGNGNSFWEYDASIDTWTQKANSLNAGMDGRTSFSSGFNGYVVFGLSFNGTITYLDTLWKYNSFSNTWHSTPNVPNPSRVGAFGFSINNKGYIGTGYNSNLSPTNYYEDFWEYDISSNTWTQKADFGGQNWVNATAFSINGKGYVGTGDEDGNHFQKDFWEYDPSTNTWTQKADFGGVGRRNAIGFSINGKGYIGTGSNGTNGNFYLKDFWQYNPTSNTWIRKADCSNEIRSSAGSFVIAGKGYVGLGYDGSNNPLNDFWAYIPD